VNIISKRGVHFNKIIVPSHSYGVGSPCPKYIGAIFGRNSTDNSIFWALFPFENALVRDDRQTLKRFHSIPNQSNINIFFNYVCRSLLAVDGSFGCCSKRPVVVLARRYSPRSWQKPRSYHPCFALTQEKPSCFPRTTLPCQRAQSYLLSATPRILCIFLGPAIEKGARNNR
jgi:hypothetical protein